jgi:hypothetical protein
MIAPHAGSEPSVSELVSGREEKPMALRRYTQKMALQLVESPIPTLLVA